MRDKLRFLGVLLLPHEHRSPWSPDCGGGESIESITPIKNYFVNRTGTVLCTLNFVWFGLGGFDLTFRFQKFWVKFWEVKKKKKKKNLVDQRSAAVKMEINYGIIWAVGVNHARVIKEMIRCPMKIGSGSEKSWPVFEAVPEAYTVLGGPVNSKRLFGVASYNRVIGLSRCCSNS